MTQNQQQHQLAYLAQGIRQLAAAAACSQIEMHMARTNRERQNFGPDDGPLVVLDTLAQRLAEPYLKTLVKLGYKPQHEEQKTQ